LDCSKKSEFLIGEMTTVFGKSIKLTIAISISTSC